MNGQVSHQIATRMQESDIRKILSQRAEDLLLRAQSTRSDRGGLPPVFRTAPDSASFSDPIDRAQWADQAFQVDAQGQVLRFQVSQVESALTRLDEGMTYGMCECCGEPIAPERLGIFPESTLCRPCKSAGEKKSQPPNLAVCRLVIETLDETTRARASRLAYLHWRHAPSTRAFELVWTHSVIVAYIAEQLRTGCSDLGLKPHTVATAALLHDIGVYRCIDWITQWKEEMAPYIQHGMIGSHVVRYEGFLEDIARVAERHVGTGLTEGEIRNGRLSLPERDYIPDTSLERLICYADKFHSKRPRFLSFDEAILEQRRFGGEKGEKMLEFRDRFGLPDLGWIRTVCESWQREFGSSSEL